MNGWKIAFWIEFVFLLIALVGVFIAYFSYVALYDSIIDVENERIECSTETCVGYDAFTYDPVEYLCSCYTNDKITKQEILK